MNPLVQELISLATLVACALGSVVWFLIRSANKKASDAERAADAAIARADKAAADVKAYAEKLVGDLRVHVAENYVTEEGLTKALNNLNRSIDQLIDTVKANMEEMRAGLSEIHRRVDGKADK